MGAYSGIAFSGRAVALSFASSRILYVGALLILVLIPLASAGAIAQRFAASIYFGRALAAASSGDIAGASASVARSLAIYKSDDAHRLAANAHMAQANAIAQSTEGDQASRTQAFQASVSAAVVEAQAAIQHSPQKYGNWLALASIYEALIPAQVEGAVQSAEQAYIEAIRRSPRNPGLYLSAARMEGTAGNEQALRDATNQALTLKPNYTDAVLLIVQLEIAKNNLQGAINASAAAVQTAPDNPGLWFQLGLLALNAGSVNDAVVALERALAIMPDYANAKYFLGLAYYQQGKTAESAGIFADLAASNPENQEVATILANMRAGKAPFEGMQTSGNPTQPATAPVKEQ
jgi:cytochrome c-type biogenesis protein CcmH/NrfG